MRSLRLLDYSLLLAVESLQPLHHQTFHFSNPNSKNSFNTSENSLRAQDRHRFKSTCGKYVYHIAVIDFLTRFSLGKRCESFYKTTIKNNKPENVSCVEPNRYARRFTKFILRQVIVNEANERLKDKRMDS